MGTIETSVQKNIEKMEAQLVEWGAKIDELAVTTEKASHEAKADYRRLLQDARAKRRAVKSKLEELKGMGTDKWETFKVGVETAWSDFEVAFKELTR